MLNHMINHPPERVASGEPLGRGGESPAQQFAPVSAQEASHAHPLPDLTPPPAFGSFEWVQQMLGHRHG